MTGKLVEKVGIGIQNIYPRREPSCRRVWWFFVALKWGRTFVIKYILKLIYSHTKAGSAYRFIHRLGVASSDKSLSLTAGFHVVLVTELTV